MRETGGTHDLRNEIVEEIFSDRGAKVVQHLHRKIWSVLLLSCQKHAICSRLRKQHEGPTPAQTLRSGDNQLSRTHLNQTTRPGEIPQLRSISTRRSRWHATHFHPLLCPIETWGFVGRTGGAEQWSGAGSCFRKQRRQPSLNTSAVNLSKALGLNVSKVRLQT